MKVTEDVRVKAGHYGYNETFYYKDSDGNVVELNDYTAKFKVWPAGVPDDLLVEGSCDIPDPDNGVLQYAVQEGDFEADDVGKDWKYEIEISKDGVVDGCITGNLFVEESG